MAERHFDAPNLFYNSGLSGGNESYIHGGQILRPSVTVRELIEEWKREDDPHARQYETFNIHDWKNDRLVEWSRAPSELSNYFTKSEKPFEISPAFFSPNVFDQVQWTRTSMIWGIVRSPAAILGKGHGYSSLRQGFYFGRQSHIKGSRRNRVGDMQ